MATGGSGLFTAGWGVSLIVPHRCGLPGRSGLVGLDTRAPVLVVRTRRWVDARRWIPGARRAVTGPRSPWVSDVRPPPDAAICVVRALLDVLPRRRTACPWSPQRSLEIRSYPTAWAMVPRLRSVLIRPGRDRLTGTVEVDETHIGDDEEPGLRGGQVKTRNPLWATAVAVKEPRACRRSWEANVADGSAASLHALGLAII